MKIQNTSNLKYRDSTGNQFEFELSDAQRAELNQANSDYLSSRQYIESTYYYIWKYAFKKYSLGMKDRAAKIKAHQSNHATGKSRTFIDIFASTLAEKPVIFTMTPVDGTDAETRDNIQSAVISTADRTKFHSTARNILIDALKTGMFSMRVGLYSEKDEVEYIEDVDGESVLKTFTMSSTSLPYCKKVDVFNIYPDPYPGANRFCTERFVAHVGTIMQDWGSLIESPTNELNQKTVKHFLENLNENKGDADVVDYGAIKTMVYEDINASLQADDTYLLSDQKQVNRNAFNSEYSRDSNVTKNLNEGLITVYNGRIVLRINGYPVYMGENIWGFIPYITKSATNPEMNIGCEGIPFLIRGQEETQDSFFNGYIDNARSIFNPTFTAIEGMFVHKPQVELSAPGQVITVQASEYGHRAIERLDKGGLTDFNILSITDGQAQAISGVSEYDQGIAARERTATGALAVSQSSSKRISPFVGTFVDCMSEVAQMWLKLMIKFWTDKQWVTITDENGKTTSKQLRNKDLLGRVNIALEMNGMFGGLNELRYKRLIESYNTLSGSEKVQVGELIAEIFRSQGLSPAKFVTDFSATKPADAQIDKPVTTNVDVAPVDELGQIIQQAVNPQTDLGNGGQGR